MANFDTIKTAIDANIKTNGNQAITGAVMNSVLKQMVDSADTELTGLESEVLGSKFTFTAAASVLYDIKAGVTYVIYNNSSTSRTFGFRTSEWGDNIDTLWVGAYQFGELTASQNCSYLRCNGACEVKVVIKDSVADVIPKIEDVKLGLADLEAKEDSNNMKYGVVELKAIAKGVSALLADGEIGYNTSVGVFVKKENGETTTYTPTYNGLYRCDGLYYRWNGAELVQDSNFLYSTDYSSRLNPFAIKTDVAIGEKVDMNPIETDYSQSVIIPVRKNDIAVISGKGGATALLWAFVDEEYNLVRKADASATAENLSLTATDNGFIIANFSNDIPCRIVVSTNLSAMTPHIAETLYKVDVIKENAEYLSKYYKGPLNVTKGEVSDYYVCSIDDAGTSEKLNFQRVAESWDGSEYNAYLYSEAIERMNDLVNSAPNYVTSNYLGLATGTNEVGSRYKLYEYVFSPKKYSIEGYNKKLCKVMLTACIHGTEKNAFFGLYCFLSDLVNNWQNSPLLTAIRTSVELRVIPILNPSGFDLFAYKNANGVNLNRDFETSNWEHISEPSKDINGETPFSQLETKLVRDWFANNKDATFYIDLHTNGGGFVGAYDKMNSHAFPQDGNVDSYFMKVANALTRNINRESMMLPAMYSGVSDLPSDHVVGAIFPSFQIGTSDVWAYETYKIPSLVCETFAGLQIGDNILIECWSNESIKISAEIIGNCICGVIHEYAS